MVAVIKPVRYALKSTMYKLWREYKNMWEYRMQNLFHFFLPDTDVNQTRDKNDRVI